MNQGDLFHRADWNETTNPRTPTDTQAKAAAFAFPKSGTARRKVYEFIRDHHGATDEETQRYLDMNPNTERPRRKELQDAGFIRDSGKRRDTISGTAAIVWEVGA